MKFENHDERIKHPQAGKIPCLIWDEFIFNQSLSDEYIELMQTDEISSIIERLKKPTSIKNLKEKKLILLLVALSHIDTNADQLCQLSQVLEMPKHAILEVAVILGNHELLNELIQTHLAPEALNATSLFLLGAQYGHLNVLRFLAEMTTPEHLENMVKDARYAPFWMAAALGQVEVLRYLVEIAPRHIDQMVATLDYAPFWKAAQNGHLAVLRYLVDIASRHHHSKMIVASQFAAMDFAIRNGHQEVVLYLASFPSNLFTLATPRIKNRLHLLGEKAMRAENAYTKQVELRFAQAKTRLDDAPATASNMGMYSSSASTSTASSSSSSSTLAETSISFDF